MTRFAFIVAGLVAIAGPAKAEIAGALKTEGQGFQVLFESNLAELPLRTFVEVPFALFDAVDQPLDGAKILIGGGMPGHGHGLPTAPEVEETENGYIIKGLKFSMGGAWELVLDIQANGLTDRLVLEIDY